MTKTGSGAAARRPPSPPHAALVGRAPERMPVLFPNGGVRGRVTGMMPAPALSLVIAVFRRPTILALVLQSLEDQTWSDFEVVLADDGSDETVAEVARNWSARSRHPIRRVWQEHRGFRKTIIVNRAARECAGDHLVFI